MTIALDILIIDDDANIARLQQELLLQAGHKVRVLLDATQAVEAIRETPPQLIIIDIMMPGIDGLEICRRIRTLPHLDHVKIIVVSAKAYDFDRARAMSMGADGMLRKPISPRTYVQDIMGVISDDTVISYWGVRGTLPVPGPKTLRYGGNTSCVSLELPRKQLIIFDAGTGIRNLGHHLLDTHEGPLSAKLLISHPHWDHINALPFFTPLFVPGNEFEIMGASHGSLTMRELISGQMDGVYFPVTIREFGSRLFFRNLGEETFTVDDIQVRTLLTSHPGNCLAYRVEVKGRSFCYFTDNELYLKDSRYYSQDYVDRMVDFIKDCDVLLTDVTYTDEQYLKRINWGHSCVTRVAEIATQGNVRELQLFHHDPDQADDDIDRKLEDARKALQMLGSKTTCAAPAEGDRKRLTDDGTLVPA